MVPARGAPHPGDGNRCTPVTTNIRCGACRGMPRRWPAERDHRGSQPAPSRAPAGGTGGRCDPNYSGACVPVPSSDLDCDDVPATDFRVTGSDPYGFDRDKPMASPVKAEHPADLGASASTTGPVTASAGASIALQGGNVATGRCSAEPLAVSQGGDCRRRAWCCCP